MLLLDVSPVVYRAWHATPDTALETFRGLIQRVTGRFRPKRNAAVACLDMPVPTFRHQMFWGYKWGRKPKDPGLRELLAEVPGELRRRGWRTIGVEGYEADDVIATLARRYGDVVIVSSDKDLYQLIGTGPGRPADRPIVLGEGAQQWDLGLDGWVGAAHVWDKFRVDLKTEPPGWICELQALIGDKVDNIPGCPGIGEVAADRLIRMYGSALAAVEAAKAGPLPADVGKQHRAIGRRLVEGEADVRLSRALVELAEVPL